MTAIPTASAPNPITLICDNCGRTFTPEHRVPTWRDLWPLARAAGWTGRGHAVGPHSCPRCSE
ncbi:hypothetical protein APASM_4024 [Actinosynnema pretiosum subsp. pretiosum]|nr:hypothetical protein APASM_4024 [Actinosynnema pretiosum subsp. pretiosum]